MTKALVEDDVRRCPNCEQSFSGTSLRRFHAKNCRKKHFLRCSVKNCDFQTLNVILLRMHFRFQHEVVSTNSLSA